MTIESEIKNYIKNYFHPYYDITLKPDSISLTEPINCIIPTEFRAQDIDTFFSHNTPNPTEEIDEILNKYDNTEIEKEYEVFCTNVIDGDTLEVDVIKKISKNIIVYDNVKTMRIRLVGINTPEKGKQGYSVSKNFVEKICKNKILYLNIDNQTPIDRYGRVLGVIIVDEKNLNQILLKERLAEIMFLPPSEFNPFEWDKTAYISSINIPELDLSPILPYLNNEFNNLVFTDRDNYDIIHKFEVYKGIIYLRLYPYNSQIRLHILPKSYKGDSHLLIFKDEFVTEENIEKINCSSNLVPPINSIFDKPGTTSSYELNYDISKETEGFHTLQINAGYKYPTTITKIFHLTGVKDETNEIIADRCTLLDANYDSYADYTNNITQFLISSNTIVPPTKNNLNIKESNANMNNNHKNGKIFHKTIKYINDDLYIEEEKKYLKHEWGE